MIEMPNLARFHPIVLLPTNVAHVSAELLADDTIYGQKTSLLSTAAPPLDSPRRNLLIIGAKSRTGVFA